MNLKHRDDVLDQIGLGYFVYMDGLQAQLPRAHPAALAVENDPGILSLGPVNCQRDEDPNLFDGCLEHLEWGPVKEHSWIVWIRLESRGSDRFYASVSGCGRRWPRLLHLSLLPALPADSLEALDVGDEKLVVVPTSAGEAGHIPPDGEAARSPASEKVSGFVAVRIAQDKGGPTEMYGGEASRKF